MSYQLKPQGLLATAASQEAGLRRRMPGLFAPGGQPVRAPRGPPRGTVTVKVADMRAAAEEARLAADRAGKVLAAMEVVPWPSEVEKGGDPNDAPAEVVFGPDLPTGDFAVQHLLAEGPAAILEERLATLDEQIRSLRAAEPVDPNMGRVSPAKRGAYIVRQVEEALVARPPPAVDAAHSRAILQDLMQQEAETSAKLLSYAASAAKLETDIAAQFVMYEESTPYVTQLRVNQSELGEGGDGEEARAVGTERASSYLKRGKQRESRVTYAGRAAALAERGPGRELAEPESAGELELPAEAEGGGAGTEHDAPTRQAASTAALDSPHAKRGDGGLSPPVPRAFAARARDEPLGGRSARVPAAAPPEPAPTEESSEAGEDQPLAAGRRTGGEGLVTVGDSIGVEVEQTLSPDATSNCAGVGSAAGAAPSNELGEGFTGGADAHGAWAGNPGDEAAETAPSDGSSRYSCSEDEEDEEFFAVDIMGAAP